MLTGIPTAACSTPWGDHLITLGVQNKQDWARLHGHELHLMAASTDLRIRPGAWQKVALLRQVAPLHSSHLISRVAHAHHAWLLSCSAIMLHPQTRAEATPCLCTCSLEAGSSH